MCIVLEALKTLDPKPEKPKILSPQRPKPRDDHMGNQWVWESHTCCGLFQAPQLHTDVGDSETLNASPLLYISALSLAHLQPWKLRG